MYLGVYLQKYTLEKHSHVLPFFLPFLAALCPAFKQVAVAFVKATLKHTDLDPKVQLSFNSFY